MHTRPRPSIPSNSSDPSGPSVPSVPSAPSVRPSRSRTSALLTVAIAVAVAMLAGCAVEPSVPATADDATPTASAPSQADRATRPPDQRETAVEPDAPDPDEPVEDHEPARVARVAGHLEADDHLDVHAAPGSEEIVVALPVTTGFGTPTVLPVLADEGDWLQVALPVRPNGSTGWVRHAEVELSTVDLAVEIDLVARELTVLDAGEVVLTTTVAIGGPDHPTPTGTFAITDKLDTGEPNGPYGPYALGLSARSEVLTDFAGGDGQVGIHGTDTPASIGQAVSHGCLRVDNAVVEQLAAVLPLGTPVTIS